MSASDQMDDFRIAETDRGVLELCESSRESLGRLMWDKDGAFTFEGDADSSAVAFLDSLNGHTAELKRVQAEVKKLKGAIEWVLNDAAYKAPEQINARYVQDRWLGYLSEVV